MELTQCQQRLFGFLFKRLGNREQAREVLQQTNLVLCRKASDFELGTNFIAWAVTVARYQALAFRKTQARERLVFTEDVANLLDASRDDVPLDASERLVQLRHCFGRLSGEHQALLKRRYDAGESIAQVAEAIGKSAGATKVRLHRLRRQLMDCIENRLQEVDA